MSRYRFIEAQRGQYPVRLLCRVLGVPVSGYYAWQQAQQQRKKQIAPAWEAALVKVFAHHKRRYGTRRLRVALRQKGYQVGRQRLRAAMRRRALHALQPKACLYPAHHRLHPRPALRAQSATRPAQAHPGQPVLGQ